MNEADIIKGRIEAFEFAANQFEVYASDHDEMKRRGYKMIHQARPGVLRDCVKELRDYAEKQREDLKALET